MRTIGVIKVRNSDGSSTGNASLANPTNTSHMKKAAAAILGIACPLHAMARGGSGGNPDGLWFVLGLGLLLGFFWIASEDSATAWKIAAWGLGALILFAWASK